MRIERPRAEARWWLTFALVYILIAVVTGWVIRSWPHPLLGAVNLTQDLAYVVGFKFVALLGLPLLVARRMGYRVRDLAPGWRPGGRAAVAVTAAYVFGVWVNGSLYAPIAEAQTRFAPGDYAVRVGIGLVLPFLMAGFPEEFVYRGMLQTRLEAVWGRTRAILVTAVLFAAWHVPPRYFAAHGAEGQAGDLVSVLTNTGLPVFVVALILGLVWDRYRSFWPLVACHTGIDTLPIITSMLQIPR
jgi:membrane protease YdiL (CAAX protease family)